MLIHVWVWRLVVALQPLGFNGVSKSCAAWAQSIHAHKNGKGCAYFSEELPGAKMMEHAR